MAFRNTLYNKIKLIITFCIFISTPSFGAIDELKGSDVRLIMEEMLSHHVEHKQFTPRLARRSLRLYIHQFDQEKLYLLADEVKPYMNMSPRKVEKLIKGYQQGNFEDFEGLNSLINKSIERMQRLRQEVIRDLVISSSQPQTFRGESYLEFARNEEELKQRLKNKIGRFISDEHRASLAGDLIPKRKEKIAALYQKRARRLEERYTDKYDHHKLNVHILKAMAPSLDAHSYYFSSEEAEEMRSSLIKEFEGIGIKLRETVDGVLISGLVRGGPADRCQEIAVGDLLYGIDGNEIASLSYDEVLKRLKVQGRSITLDLYRCSNHQEGHYLSVRLKPEKIALNDERLQYELEPFGDGVIAKFTLPSFYESSNGSSADADLRKAITKIRNSHQLYGIILDMRYNAGGFLTQAVKVSGLFITSGVIVVSKYSQGTMKFLRNTGGKALYDGPLLVLTSRASASAAEIVAQALQDYGAALIVGDQQTYGKGSIQYQTVTDRYAKAYFKVTVGKYYTVSGRTAQIEGVKSDIVLPTEFSFLSIGEKYREFALQNDRIDPIYKDTLTDLDPKAKEWFQKNYIPFLQQRRQEWSDMLPNLKRNTAYRLENNKNYKLFYEEIERHSKNYLRSPPSKQNNWGVEDLQMEEGINILKDVIYLHRQ